MSRGLARTRRDEDAHADLLLLRFPPARPISVSSRRIPRVANQPLHVPTHRASQLRCRPELHGEARSPVRFVLTLSSSALLLLHLSDTIEDLPVGLEHPRRGRNRLLARRRGGGRARSVVRRLALDAAGRRGA